MFQHSYDELRELYLFQGRVIAELRKENEKLNKQINKFAKISMKQAMASDQMKLELIIFESSNTPKE